jgi:hypothetical protein
MMAGGRLGAMEAVERRRMVPSRRPSAPQQSSWTTPESAVARTQWRVVAPPTSGLEVKVAATVRRVLRGALAAIEGRGGLVPCPRRDAPAQENAAATGPALEKASGERLGRQWRGAVTKNAPTASEED